MPAFVSTSTGINVQKMQVFVGHYFQDMRMATDKNTVDGWLLLQNWAYSGRVPAWIAANMGHKNRYPITFKTQIHRHFCPDFSAVDVAIHAAQRLECLKFINNFRAAKIACMPDFVAFGKMLEHALVEEGMGVG